MIRTTKKSITKEIYEKKRNDSYKKVQESDKKRKEINKKVKERN